MILKKLHSETLHSPTSFFSSCHFDGCKIRQKIEPVHKEFIKMESFGVCAFGQNKLDLV